MTNNRDMKWEYVTDKDTGLRVLRVKKDPKALEKSLKLADELFSPKPDPTPCKFKPGDLSCEECDDWVLVDEEVKWSGVMKKVERCRRHPSAKT